MKNRFGLFALTAIMVFGIATGSGAQVYAADKKDPSVITLPTASWGREYSYKLDEGVELVSGELPKGLSFDEVTREISGTPDAEAAGHEYVVVIQDGKDQAQYKIKVPERIVTDVNIKVTEPIVGMIEDDLSQPTVTINYRNGSQKEELSDVKGEWKHEVAPSDEEEEEETSVKEIASGDTCTLNVSGSLPTGYAFDSAVLGKVNGETARISIGKNKRAISCKYTFANIGESQKLHTVTFVGNEPQGVTNAGKNKVQNQQIRNMNLAADPTEPTCKGYVFSGWSEDKDGKVSVDLDEKAITEDTVLYARWSKILQSASITIPDVFESEESNIPEVKSEDAVEIKNIFWSTSTESDKNYTGSLKATQKMYLNGNIYAVEGETFLSTDKFSMKVNGAETPVRTNEDGSYRFTVEVPIKIPAHVHDIVWVERIVSTCESNGYVEHYRCTVCGERFKDAEGKAKITDEEGILVATGHNYGDWVVSKAAGCETVGEEIRVCINNPNHKEIRSIPATGHKYGDWTVTANPTCEQAGEETHVCLNDSSHKEARTIPALGHSYGDWSVTTPATCSQEGVQTRVCANDKNHTETKAISRSGHTWGEWVKVKEPTEAEAGKSERTCKVCGTKETQAIPQLNHTHVLEKKAAVAATCEKDGNIEYYQCSGCRKIFSDASAKSEISKVSIPAKGHSWGDWKITKTATTTEDGARERVCTVCGQKATEAVQRIAAPENKVYQVSDPDNLTWARGSADGLKITSSAPGGRLTGIYVDGKVVPVTSYVNVRPVNVDGNTDLTLKATYLENLDSGDHSVELRFTNGSALAKFSVSGVKGAAATATPIPTTETSPTPQPTAKVDQKATSTKKANPNVIIPIILAIAVIFLVVLLVLVKKGIIAEDHLEQIFKKKNNKPKH